MKSQTISSSDIRVAWSERKIRPSSVTNTGKISFKWGAQASESELEAGFLKLLAFDPDIANVRSQPFTLYWPDGKGGERKYTPDVLLQYRAQLNNPSALKGHVREVKPSHIYEKHRDEFEKKFEIARIWCKAEGYDFGVITELSYSTAHVWNAQFLMRYGDDKLMCSTAEAKARSAKLLRAVAELGKTTPTEVLTAISSDPREWAHLLPQLWHLVCKRAIRADFKVRLAMGSAIWPASPSFTGPAP